MIHLYIQSVFKFHSNCTDLFNIYNHMNLVVNFFAKKVLEFCLFWHSTIINDRFFYMRRCRIFTNNFKKRELLMWKAKKESTRDEYLHMSMLVIWNFPFKKSNWIYDCGIYSKASRCMATNCTDLAGAHFWNGSKQIWDEQIYAVKTLSSTVFWSSCLHPIK